MNKYIGFLIVFGVLVFGVLVISNSVYASVLDDSCSNGEIYSSTTGQVCLETGCLSGQNYSPITGQACPTTLAPSITVLSPNGGESYTVGQQITVKWKSWNLPNIGSSNKIKIYLKKESSTNVAYGIETIDDGVEIITLPITSIGTDFKIQVRLNVGPTTVYSPWSEYYDFSDDTFTINSSTIACTMEAKQCSDGSYVSRSGPNCEFRSCPTLTAPIISGISGPQTLNVNQTGTWKVTASDPNGGNLSYSVNWGDVYYATSVVQPSINIQQSATFTHSYSYATTYTPIFTVTNESGQSATTSLSVKVNASNDGCLPGYIYSPMTGQKCPIAIKTCLLPEGCVFPATPITRTLRMGTKGEDVKTLQSFLGVTADGSFGPITQAKVIEWQASNSLTPDGVFGPMSLQKANLTE